MKRCLSIRLLPLVARLSKTIKNKRLRVKSPLLRKEVWRGWYSASVKVLNQQRKAMRRWKVLKMKNKKHSKSRIVLLLRSLKRLSKWRKSNLSLRILEMRKLTTPKETRLILRKRLRLLMLVLCKRHQRRSKSSFSRFL